MVKKLIFFFLVAVPVLLPAQTPRRIMIEGEVRDTLYAPVPFVNVLVPERNEGCASDVYGKFRLPVVPGDILLFSAVSYKTSRIRIPDTLTAERYWLKIILTADTLLLNEVTITPPTGTWDEFRETELALDLPEYAVDALTRLYIKDDLAWLFEVTPGMPGPAGILYEIFGKRPREERKLKAVLTREALEEKIVQRYNPYVVSRLTGLKSEAAIVRLMKYCNLNLPFILWATDYDLYYAIMQCYRQYQIPNPRPQIPNKSQDPNPK